MALAEAGRADAGALGCKSGPFKLGDATAVRFCGSATATVKVAGRAIVYRGGSCERRAAYLAVNIGSMIPGAPMGTKGLPQYFGLAAGRMFGVGAPAPRDGSYSGQTLAFINHGDRSASFSVDVTLSDGRTRGTFTGRLLGGERVSGTFRCG
jgi:hypothetical protein